MISPHIDWAPYPDIFSTLRQHMAEQPPLIQCLTNNVTVNFVANAILAFGGAPAMVDFPGEAAEFAAVSSAVLINLGTLHADQREGIPIAAESAHTHGVPWVLDPVAVGTLPVRTALSETVLPYRPTVIRGNASEIISVSGRSASGRGVETGDSVTDAKDAAKGLATATGAIVAVSGSSDLITDGTKTVFVNNGTELFTKVTGAGCALGGVLATGLGAARGTPGVDVFDATVTTILAYTIAGERAAAQTQGPGSFAVGFLDALAALSADDIASEMRVTL